MTLCQAYDEFIFRKRVDGLKKISIDDYKNSLIRFLRLLGDEEIDDLTYDQVANYILGLYNTKLSRATISTYVRNVRIFLRWISDEYGLCFDARKIKIPRSPKKKVHIYSNPEIMDIFNRVGMKATWLTARNKLIVALMLDSGVRQCEVCGLNWEDIDEYRSVMKVTGKGSKERVVPLGETSVRLMHEYKGECPYKTDYVFASRTGKRLSENAIKIFTNRLQKELSFKFSSHRLRHNFATNYCIDNIHQNGATNVFDLSILMGHESIETTKQYEHFAHELIAVENSISHLDMVNIDEQSLHN